MKGDLPLPAFRLLTELPVRTHERRHIEHLQGRKVVANVIIDGVRYSSLSHAARELHICRESIRRMLRTGEAVYA